MHTLAITEQGTSLHAEGDLLLVRRGNSVIRRIRASELDQVLLFGRIELSSGAMILLLRRSVEAVLLTSDGRFRGRLTGRRSRNVQLRLAQYQRATDPAFCLAVARPIVVAKLQNQRQLLLRAQRRLRDPDLAVALGTLRVLATRAAGSEQLDVLRGLEGQAAALYFAHFDKLILNPEFHFHGRSRRPPRDAVNALLSFGYAVWGSIIETELLSCGLDPMLGFFHQPAYGRPSLMLDILEQFRPQVDSLVLRLINRRQLRPADFERRSGKQLEEILAETADDQPEETQPEQPGGEQPLPQPSHPPATTPAPSLGADQPAAQPEPPFDPSPPPSPPPTAPPEVVGVYLADVGRKVFLHELFRRLRQRLYYPPRQAQLELREIIRQEIYHMARVIEAKDPQYQPFTPP